MTSEHSIIAHMIHDDLVACGSVVDPNEQPGGDPWPDAPALGRMLLHEAHADRPALLARLRRTPRDQWTVLARAYLLALGETEFGHYRPTEKGVVWLWSQLIPA